MCILHFPDSSGIIFIHIPKTGGSSVTEYFKQKYNLTNDNDVFVGYNARFSHSMQHCTWNEYYQNWDTFFCAADAVKTRDINLYEVFTIVRNPYTRTISDFYWWMRVHDDKERKNPSEKLRPDRITLEYMETFIENILNDITDKEKTGNRQVLHDTHALPQYMFLEGIFPEKQSHEQKITILKQENLTEQMRARFCDFDKYDNTNPNSSKIPYSDLLTPKIISMVNSVYARDFELFGYDLLKPEDGVKQPSDLVVIAQKNT